MLDDIEQTAEKDPNDWVTGDEPATGAQMSYLKTLAHDSDSEDLLKDNISKAEASELIDKLQDKSKRVADQE